MLSHLSVLCRGSASNTSSITFPVVKFRLKGISGMSFLGCIIVKPLFSSYGLIVVVPSKLISPLEYVQKYSD